MWSAESRFILPSPIDEQDTLEQEVCQDDANQDVGGAAVAVTTNCHQMI